MKIELDSSTVDYLVTDILKDHYPHLTYEWSNPEDKKMYKKLRKAFRLIIQYYGGEVKK